MNLHEERGIHDQYTIRTQQIVEGLNRHDGVHHMFKDLLANHDIERPWKRFARLAQIELWVLELLI